MKNVLVMFSIIIFALTVHSPLVFAQVPPVTALSAPLAPIAPVSTTALDAASQAGFAAGGNGGLAAGSQKACTSSVTGAIFCVYMAVSAAQMIMDLVGSGQSASVAAATSDTTGTGTVTNTPGNAGTAQQMAQAMIQDAASKGVVLSPDGSSVTLPNGATVPTASMSSSQGLQNAGLTAGQAAQVLADAGQIAAKVKSQYNVAAMGTEGGGGGGSALNHGSDGAGDEGDSSKLKSLLGALNKNRKPASMAGMTKKLGNTGENIGVSGDDIFLMVSRQYLRKDGQGSFLKTP